ncbi:MAG: ROK family glucokinase [Sedimentisphaerales bacterium]|nr:ROK family glucokinase [Sedimentisphaerales bacterium]
MNRIFVGIDLGATNIKFGCFNGEMELLGKTSVPTNADMGPEAVINRMDQTVRELISEKSFSLDNVIAVGMGSPGPAKYRDGIIIASTNMPKFRNVSICRILGEKLGKPVVLDNDANVACWGEYVVGAGKGVKDMVFFTLGSGIGGGIICDGELVRGWDGNGAELGHIIYRPGGRSCNCGQRGCVEAYASANSTAKRATEAIEASEKSSLEQVLKEKGQITSKDVYEHLAAGDDLARRVTDETAQALAILCVNMLHVTEPRRIVFAGGMIAAGDILLERIRYYFGRHIWTLKKEPLEICFATLGEDAGIVGAAALARHYHPQ